MGGYETINDLDTEVRAGVLASLFDDERFLGAIRCTDAFRSSRQTRLVLTDKRLLVFKPGADSYPLKSIDRGVINGVNYAKGIVTRKLSITNLNGFSEEWDLDINGADAFVELVRNRPTVSTDDEHSPISMSPRTTSSARSQWINTESQTGKSRTSLSSDGESSTDVWVDANKRNNTTNYAPAVADFSQSELRSQLQTMDDYEFEHFVADLWKNMGWETTVSQASADAGIDVIATKETPYPEKKVIQAKRYGENTTVGGPDIQQYASLKHQVSGADSVIIATTGSFTSAAEERASELNVKTVDGERLVGMIDTLDARDLAAEYLDIPLEPQTVPNERSQNSFDTAETPPDDGYYDSANESTSSDSQLSRSPARGSSKTNAGSIAANAMAAAQSIADQATGADISPSQINNASTSGNAAPRISSTVGNWHYGIIGTTSLLVLAVAVNAGSLASLSILALPVVTYLDIRDVRTATEDWQPRAWLYVIGVFLLFFIAVPAYLYYRNKAIGL